jgi:hypothetical protein
MKLCPWIIPNIGHVQVIEQPIALALIGQNTLRYHNGFLPFKAFFFFLLQHRSIFEHNSKIIHQYQQIIYPKISSTDGLLQRGR